MNNSVINTAVIIEAAGIAAFITAIALFDTTFANNDPAVAALFFGMCLFGLAGLFTEDKRGAADAIPAAIGVIGVLGIAAGIALGLAGIAWSYIAIAFGITAMLGTGLFSLAVSRR